MNALYQEKEGRVTQHKRYNTNNEQHVPTTTWPQGYTLTRQTGERKKSENGTRPIWRERVQYTIKQTKGNFKVCLVIKTIRKKRRAIHGWPCLK